MILLTVCNRKTATTVNEVNYPHVIISISTPQDDYPNLVQNEFTDDVFRLKFHDLDRPPGPSFRECYGEPVLFSEEMARHLAFFVVGCETQGIKGFHIHCDAGQSRSVGVAAALAKHYNGDDQEWWSSPGPHASARTPNRLVYTRLLAALQGKRAFIPDVLPTMFHKSTATLPSYPIAEIKKWDDQVKKDGGVVRKIYEDAIQSMDLAKLFEACLRHEEENPFRYLKVCEENCKAAKEMGLITEEQAKELLEECKK